MTGDSISQVKQAIRERVWELLEPEHVTEPGVRGYIPAFAGTEIAAGLLAGTPEWEAARVIKAVPDRDWMGDQLRLWTTTARTEVREPRLEMLSSPLVRLLEAADGELRDEIVAALGGYGKCAGMPDAALRSAQPAARRTAGLDVVADFGPPLSRRPHGSAEASSGGDRARDHPCPISLNTSLLLSVIVDEAGTSPLASGPFSTPL